MPRPSSGPKLVRIQRAGWTRPVYYVRWYERGNKRLKSTGASGLDEAENFLGQWLSRRGSAPGTGPRDPDRFLIADALADYAEERAPHLVRPAEIGYAIDQLLDYWGDLKVSAIRPQTCKRYARDRVAKRVHAELQPDGKTKRLVTTYSPASTSTSKRELAILRAAVNHAAKEGRLTTAPYVWTPPAAPGRDRWLTREEAAALLRASRGERARLYLPLFILIGLYTGARKSAILGLKWSQVDLVNGRIDFNPRGRAQTSKRRPVIPIPPKLRVALRRAHARASCPYVVARDGKALRDIKKGFAAAADRAGLEGVSPHTLRHTAGTWMAQAGVDLYQIGGFLGHNQERTTELYAHHHPDFMRDAAQALNRRG